MNGSRYFNLSRDNLKTHTDNNLCHRSRIAAEYLKAKQVQVLDWPGNSPDLNTTENLCCNVKNKAAENEPVSAAVLVGVMKCVWCTKISQAYCEFLIHSILNGIPTVIKSKGSIKKY